MYELKVHLRQNLNIWLHVFEIFTILIGILDKFFVPLQFLSKNTF